MKKVIEQYFDVIYHQNYISRLLDEMGWSVQKPDPGAIERIERDEKLILTWLKQNWLSIKKTQHLSAEIIFEVEFGFSCVEPVSFIWASKGQTQHFKRVGCYRRETLTTVGLTISGKIYNWHFDSSIKRVLPISVSGLNHPKVLKQKVAER